MYPLWVLDGPAFPLTKGTHEQRRGTWVLAPGGAYWSSRGSSVLAGCTLMAVAYAATSGHSAPPAVTSAAAGPDTANGARVQPGGIGHLIGPRTTHPGARNATTISTNWSGYAATGGNGSFTSVSSSWAEPMGTCRSGNQYSSFWVGLDGYNSGSVEQTGSEVDCSGSTPHYYS